jgi:hypothetical protein
MYSKFVNSLTMDKSCTSDSASEPLRSLDKFLRPFPLLFDNEFPNSSPTAERKLSGYLKFAFVKVINKSVISA